MNANFTLDSAAEGKVLNKHTALYISMFHTYPQGTVVLWLPPSYLIVLELFKKTLHFRGIFVALLSRKGWKPRTDRTSNQSYCELPRPAPEKTLFI